MYSNSIVKGCNEVKKAFLAVVSILVLTMVAGVAFAAEGPIKIGVINSMTGQNAFGGELEVGGVRLANRLYPEALGRKIELIIVDNKTDKVESANAASRLIERDKVVAIIGPYGSSMTMAAGEVCEKAGIPLMGTGCTNPLVTEGKKYVFRPAFIDPFQGAGAANYTYNTLGFKKAALLIDVASDYSVGLGNFFKKTYTELGGTVVAEMKYQSGDTDFTSQLTELIGKGPDLVFIPAYFAEGAVIMKQARELGATFRFMGGDAMDNPEIVTLGGDAVDGFLHTTFAYDPSMPNMNEIQKAFTKDWEVMYAGKAPNANAALGHDAYVLIREAILRAGKADPESIRNELEKTKDVPTVTGMTTLDENHNAVKDMGVVEIKDGKKAYIDTIKP